MIFAIMAFVFDLNCHFGSTFYVFCDISTEKIGWNAV